jgi:hypothetical protein
MVAYDENVDRYSPPALSPATAITAVTTRGTLVQPDPADKKPPAPVLDKRSVTFNGGTIFWQPFTEAPSGNAGYKVSFEYQIIRMQGVRMNDWMMETSDLSFAAVYPYVTAEPLPPMAGFNLFHDGKEPVLEYWNKADGAFGPLPSSLADIGCEYGALEVSLTDIGLAPNTVYFYYVRTVRVITEQTPDGEVRKHAYSTWSEISMTTLPITAPHDLRVVRTGNNFLFPSYNPKNDIVVEFLTLVKPEELGAPNGYELFLTYMKNNEDWVDQINITKDLRDAANPNGNLVWTDFVMIGNIRYERYRYRVTGLDSGSNYSFRVRIFSNQFKDYSIWSNIAESRTEFDQSDYDKDKATGDWDKFLKEALSDLLYKNNVWSLTSGVTNTVVYRPSVWNNTVSRPGTMIYLDAPLGSREYVYYIPQSAMNDANVKGKGFAVQRGNLESLIPSNMIERTNGALVAATAHMNNRTTRATDLYYKITVSYQAQNSGNPVDGHPALSDGITTRIDLVTINEKAEFWDLGIVEFVRRFLDEDANFADALKRIYEMVEKGYSNEQILSYIDTYVLAKAADVRVEINRSLSRTLEVSHRVDTAKTMTLSLLGADAKMTVGGYRFDVNRWASMVVQNDGVRRNIQTLVNQTYIFNVHSVSFTGVQNQRALEILGKYSLQDHLGGGASFDASRDATLSQLVNATARIGGANATASGADFLRTKGYAVTVRNTTQRATVQEAVYLTMVLYEIRTNTSVTTIQITNFGLTSGIRGIDPAYLRSVQAAFELGVITEMPNPGAPVTIGEYLDMLVRLDRIVRL